jgi:hypothetical protein
MKKILLSLLCLTLVFSAFAQSFSLQDTNGIAIPAGSKIQILGDPTAPVITAKVHVKNNAAEAKEVKVKKLINEGDTLPLTMNYFCWGVCYGPTTYVSPFPQTIQAGAVNDQFYGDYNPQSIPGKSTITYVFFDMNNVNDSVAVTVEFNASPATADNELPSEICISSAYPNPAINTVCLDYNLPGAFNKASVVISNILGAQVKEVVLYNNSGKVQIPVSDLENGIYFYSVVADNQLVVTRKFVVKR